MRTVFVIVALIVPVIALALPDDATLSRFLVGTWHGHRHDTQYRDDGTWIMDPPDEGDNSRGKWRIEHGRLITTWRFSGESSDSTAVEEIIELTEKIFKSRIISQGVQSARRSGSSERDFHCHSCNDEEIGRLLILCLASYLCG